MMSRCAFGCVESDDLGSEVELAWGPESQARP